MCWQFARHSDVHPLTPADGWVGQPAVLGCAAHCLPGRSWALEAPRPVLSGILRSMPVLNCPTSAATYLWRFLTPPASLPTAWRHRDVAHIDTVPPERIATGERVGKGAAVSRLGDQRNSSASGKCRRRRAQRGPQQQHGYCGRPEPAPLQGAATALPGRELKDRGCRAGLPDGL